MARWTNEELAAEAVRRARHREALARAAGAANTAPPPDAHGRHDVRRPGTHPARELLAPPPHIRPQPVGLPSWRTRSFVAVMAIGAGVWWVPIAAAMGWWPW